jgi:hypothetical protein
MNTRFGKSFLIALALGLAASFSLMSSFSAAAAGRGGGGGGGGQAAAAGGGGGGRQAAQVNNNRADNRTTNVRNTSVNNVNVNKNVNVNVDNSGCCNNNGWDNDHPIATAAVVTATVVAIGSMVRTVPPGCVPVNYGGIVYQQCGTVWYQPQGSQFVVVGPPY